MGTGNSCFGKNAVTLEILGDSPIDASVEGYDHCLMGHAEGMFEGFVEERIDVGSSRLFVRHGGEGPPVLLLHGHPRTSATWHRVAPRLVNAGFRVICPDLRGYGRSSKPAPTADHSAHAKMGQENYDEWRQAIHDPDTVRAMLEDYRAGLTIDRQHEEADRKAGRKDTAPLLLLWSLRDDLEDLYGNPLKIWDPWASDFSGHGIDSGHHMAEEAPHELSAALIKFLQIP